MPPTKFARPASGLPVFPHKLEESYRVAHWVNVAGVAAFVNRPDGNTDNPVAGARGLDQHLGFGLETRGREPQIPQYIASQQSVAALAVRNPLARQLAGDPGSE